MNTLSNDKVKYTNSRSVEILDNSRKKDQEEDFVSWRFDRSQLVNGTNEFSDKKYGSENIVSESEKPRTFNQRFVMKPRKIQKFLNKFIALQKWEGYVETVENDSIISRVADLTNPSETHERAEFSFDDVNEYDIELVKPGAIFYWSIGHEEVNGTRKRASYIQFRRLPPLTPQEIADIKQNVIEIGKGLKWE